VLIQNPEALWNFSPLRGICTSHPEFPSPEKSPAISPSQNRTFVLYIIGGLFVTGFSVRSIFSWRNKTDLSYSLRHQERNLYKKFLFF
jgi:hypothetical protein